MPRIFIDQFEIRHKTCGVFFFKYINAEKLKFGFAFLPNFKLLHSIRSNICETKNNKTIRPNSVHKIYSYQKIYSYM